MSRGLSFLPPHSSCTELGLWQAIDRVGDLIGVLVTRLQERVAAERLFSEAPKQRGRASQQPVADQIRINQVAYREVFLCPP